MKNLIQELGWDKNKNYIKIEVRYKKPEMLNNSIGITFEEIIQSDFIEILKEDFLRQYKRLEVCKSIEISPTKESISTPALLLYHITQNNINGSPIDDIINSINNIPDDILSKANKRARRYQIRKIAKGMSENKIVDKFDLTEILISRLKNNNPNS